MVRTKQVLRQGRRSAVRLTRNATARPRLSETKALFGIRRTPGRLTLPNNGAADGKAHRQEPAPPPAQAPSPSAEVSVESIILPLSIGIAVRTPPVGLAPAPIKQLRPGSTLIIISISKNTNCGKYSECSVFVFRDLNVSKRRISEIILSTARPIAAKIIVSNRKNSTV